MPPKKNLNGNNVSRKSFALIWWIHEGQKDIVPASKLPRKNRDLNSIVKLKWENFITKKVELHDAKIIAFDTNYDKLNSILLDDKGQIREFHDKLFTKEVLNQKRKADDDKKQVKKSKIETTNILEDKLLSTPSIFKNSSKIYPKSQAINSNTALIVNNIENVEPGTETNSLTVETDALIDTQFNFGVKPRSFPLHKQDFNVAVQKPSNYIHEIQDEVVDRIVEPLDFSKSNNNFTISTTEVEIHEKPGEQITTEDITNTNTNVDIEVVNVIEEKEVFESHIGALHTFMPKNFTENDILQIESIYAGLEEAHKQQLKNNSHVSALVTIPTEYKVPGENKVEIWNGTGLYLPGDRITYIINNSVDKLKNPNWKKFVTLVMLEVYGDSIGNFSANGKRGSAHPGIDANLFEAIFNWVKSRFPQEKITKCAYNTIINNVAWKKRTKIISAAPDEISEENLIFFKKIVTALKKNITWQNKSDLLEESIHHLLKPDSNKSKICEKYSVYFPNHVISYIERKSATSPDTSNWKILVKEALLEIYGSDLKNFSAKGQQSKYNMGIDPQVFKAIHSWAQSRSKEEIKETTLVSYINRIISNKRQCSGGTRPHTSTDTKNQNNESSSCGSLTNSKIVEIENYEDRFVYENEMNLVPVNLTSVCTNIVGQLTNDLSLNSDHASNNSEYLQNLHDNVIQNATNILQYDSSEGNVYYNL